MRTNHRLGIALVLTAATCAAAIAGPRRLLGWYAVFYIGGKRVVCANPTVWDGVKVISCDNVVAVDSEQNPADAPANAVPPEAFKMPIFPDYPKAEIDAEVDLWAKRLTFQTRNAKR